MNQPHLFDSCPTDDTETNPKARRSDPHTSHAGAEHIKSSAGYLQGIFVECLRSSRVPMTANETAAAGSARHQVMPESLRKRAKELVRTGDIYVTGERTCNITGRQAQTYKART